MVSFKPPPWDPDAAPIVVATPAEVHALRPAIRAAIYRHNVPQRNIDDVAQDVEIVTWRALEEERVRGWPPMSPGDALLAYVLTVARCLAANYRLLSRNRCELPAGIAELEPVDEHDLEAQIEARDLLSKLAGHTTADVLLGAALDEPLRERAQTLGVKKGTLSERLTQTRRWFRAVAESGRWREPRQHPPRRPRDKKKGR